MRKLFGCALVLLLVCGVAQAQIFESNIQKVPNTDPYPTEPYIRYYTHETGAGPQVSPAGQFNCGGKAIWDPPYCKSFYAQADAKQTYRAFTENKDNWDPPLSFGDEAAAVWDLELNDGTAQRTGYYGWATGTINDGDTYLWYAEDCVGTLTASCLGPLNPASGEGHEIPNVPFGEGTDSVLENEYGMRPIPVPKPQGYDPATGIIDYAWEPASNVGPTALDADYELWYFVDDGSDGLCDFPIAGSDFTYLKDVPETTGTIDVVNELGLGATSQNCVFAALKIVYPPAGGTDKITTRYVSRSGQAVYLADDGTAVTVTNIQAKWIGGTNVQVSWETGLEDGLVGFYVTRGLSANGPFERVSDLIRANGEPSAYNFIDRISIPGGLQTVPEGLFYQIETIDIDDEILEFGPVQADLPVQTRPRVAPERQIRGFRR